MMQTERRHHFSREKHHVPYRKPVAQIQHFDWSDFVVHCLTSQNDRFSSLVTDQGKAKKPYGTRNDELYVTYNRLIGYTVIKRFQNIIYVSFIICNHAVF